MVDAGKVERREVYFRGMVQGVGFRYTTRRIASRYDVTGYVENLPDGRVLLVAEGRPSELDHFLNAVRAAMDQFIDDVQVSVHPPTNQFRTFDIRY